MWCPYFLGRLAPPSPSRPRRGRIARSSAAGLSASGTSHSPVVEPVSSFADRCFARAYLIRCSTRRSLRSCLPSSRALFGQSVLFGTDDQRCLLNSYASARLSHFSLLTGLKNYGPLILYPVGVGAFRIGRFRDGYSSTKTADTGGAALSKRADVGAHSAGMSRMDTRCAPRALLSGTDVHAWTSSSALGRVCSDKLALQLPQLVDGTNFMKVITLLVSGSLWLHHLLTVWTCPEQRVVSRETSQSAAG